MKKQTSLLSPILWAAFITLLVLAIPFTAMQFTSQVNWSPFDFIIMGLLIFSTGMAYILISRTSSGILYKLGLALAIGTTFLLIWANLAVGLIGSGPNTANLMYAGIVVLVIAGPIVSGFTAKGLERLMFTIAVALVFTTAIQLVAGLHRLPGSSVEEVVAVNALFTILFTVSGILFHTATLKQTPAVKSRG